MQTEQYAPPPQHPLEPYVQAIWRVKANRSYTTETILPKGNVDLLFNFGDPLTSGDDQSSHNLIGAAGAYVAGLYTGAFTNRPQGEVWLLGVSLKVDTCTSILPLPLAELINQTIEARHVFADAPQWIEPLAESASFAQQCDLLSDWLVQRINPNPNAALVHQACLALRQCPTEARIAEQAQQLHLSTRHLRRLFYQHIGIGPAAYLQMVRFVQCLELMSTPSSLTQIAQEAHYFDQAHFCRDFKSIAGMTPQQYRAGVGHVPGHLFT
ncbi:MAG: helix-turn-helix transcriptional regulator [Chloroflexi bacterium]|nr:helix-turn-helix transcriptional regulator [Chloroflexota bacterium]